MVPTESPSVTVPFPAFEFIEQFVKAGYETAVLKLKMS